MLSINRLALCVPIFGAVLGFAAGCAKNIPPATAPEAKEERVSLVKTSERSAHFAAVTSRLELGGTVFGYVDVDGDMTKLAAGLQNFAKQATASQPMAQAFVPDDLAPFFVDLGLTDVKAVGFSSVAETAGVFRNRVFFHTPEGRHGLLAGLGGEQGPFAIPALAPADADLVFETEIDAPSAYAAIRAVVARAAGEPAAKAMDAKLAQAESGFPFLPEEILAAAKGRFSLVLCIDDERTFAAGSGIVLPAFDLVIRQEHGGLRLAEVVAKAPGVKSESRPGGVRAFVWERDVPPLGWRPELLVSGDGFVIATRAGLLAPGEAKLADDPVFRAALAAVGETGNGLTYLSPRLSARVARAADLNKKMPNEQKLVMERVLALLPEPGAALVAVRQNSPDGILFKSRWNSSLKRDLMMANPGVIAGTGLMAAMAIPAFQKVRAVSQEKAVRNNLRQLAAASDQYFLERGKDACVYADLVGPDKYIRVLSPVAGEDYSKMIFRKGAPLRVRLGDGKIVEHAR